jgi:HlyD family secretion protein
MNTDAKINTAHAHGTFIRAGEQDRLLEPRGFWSRHRWHFVGAASLALVVAILAWALFRFGGAQRSIDRSQITIATVQRGTFERDVAADGQVVAAVSPTLYAPSGGTVTLKAHAGDTVAKGQILATVDSTDLSAKLSQEVETLQNLSIDWKRARLEADSKFSQLRDIYRQAQIDRRTAESELERSRKAYELGSYPQLAVLRSEATFEKAQFAEEQAKANYDSQPKQNQFDIDSKKSILDRQRYVVEDLRHQIDLLQIRSPVAGMVGQVQVPDRASVAKDSPLLTVVDLSALEVQIKVPETLARELASGMGADLDGAGKHWKGVISAVSPQVINGDVTARVRFTDHNLAGLRQNQRLSVRIFIDKRENVLMVDRGQFLEQQGGEFVYTVHENIAERHPVRLGEASAQKVEILAGLQPGDQIVISGADTFYGAQRIILAN